MNESGAWHDNPPPPPVPEESSLEKRMKAAANARKATLTPERIRSLLPSEDLQKAFGAIKAQTMSLFNLAVLEKQQNVLEVREKGIPNEAVMKEFPLVYVGSGTDIEYPLSLGSRNVLMVDPFLGDPKGIESLRRKITALSGANVTEDSGRFRFMFDFGAAKEEVSITVDPRVYAKGGDDHVEQKERFTPPAEIGGLLAFQSGDPTEDLETVNCIVPGGLILSNRWAERFVMEFFAAEPGLQEYFTSAPIDEKRTILDGIYTSKGFESVHLESFGDSYSSTLLRKMQANEAQPNNI